MLLPLKLLTFYVHFISLLPFGANSTHDGCPFLMPLLLPLLLAITIGRAHQSIHWLRYENKPALHSTDPKPRKDHRHLSYGLANKQGLLPRGNKTLRKGLPTAVAKTCTNLSSCVHCEKQLLAKSCAIIMANKEVNRRRIASKAKYKASFNIHNQHR